VFVSLELTPDFSTSASSYYVNCLLASTFEDGDSGRIAGSLITFLLRHPCDCAVDSNDYTVCGIACQETAFVWLGWLNTLSVNDILARCVFDASGDFPGTQRSAFPRNTNAFRTRYGDEFTQTLIAEANATRALRHFGSQQWVYKGYGIYQYDLQHVTQDESFFRQKQWYEYDKCLDKLMRELKQKYQATHDLWKAIKAYNGSGPRATAYANNVIQLAHYCSEVNG
jgi:hypothetical protein